MPTTCIKMHGLYVFDCFRSRQFSISAALIKCRHDFSVSRNCNNTSAANEPTQTADALASECHPPDIYKHQHTKTGNMPRYHPLACAGGLFAGSKFLLHISYMHCHKKITTTGFQLVNTNQPRSQKIRGDNPRVFSEVKDTVLLCCQKISSKQQVSSKWSK